MTLLADLALWAISLMVGLVLPFTLHRADTLAFLTQLESLVGPTFWFLTLFLCLAIGSCIQAVLALPDIQRGRALCGDGLDAANNAMWFGFIGTYIAMLASISHGGVTHQAVAQAMTSTLIGALAVATAGSASWVFSKLHMEQTNASDQSASADE